MSARKVDFSEIGSGGYTPGYVGMSGSGELSRRAGVLEERLSRCDLCPRGCGVDRNGGKTGYCGVDGRLKVAAINLHPWEEPPISGTGGSGTVFVSGCTLRCLFCQNYPISQFGVGREMSAEYLASQMLRLQEKGAHNINLVTPTHQIAGLARALDIAAKRGLRIPLVYNSSGYESVETLAVLDGIIDIYLPDIKYSDASVAQKFSGAADYVRRNRVALIEMWRQVGGIQTDSSGIARRGMIVRHMVLPEDLAGTSECLSFLAREIGPGVWVSLMNQYFPAHRGVDTPPLDRKVSEEEYEAACAALTGLGLINGFVQEC
ncbi:MAG: radical SAM protein [Syntrophobacteraceae bacterium]